MALYLSFDESLSLFTSNLPMVAVDTETNGEDIRDGRGYAQGISVGSRIPGVGVRAAYLPFRHRNVGAGLGTNLGIESLAQLKEVIENYDGYLIFHNAKFDLESLSTLGINYKGKFFCTLKIAQLINENKPYSYDLNSCCRHYIGQESKKESELFLGFKKLYGWSGIPPIVMEEYGAQDAVLHYLLMEALMATEEFDENLKKYWDEQKIPFHDVIRTMERRGITIDTDLCKRMIVHGEISMDEIVEILGLNPGSGKDLEELLINQLGLPVVKTSKKTGKPSFDKEAMEQYEAMLELRDDITAQHILDYRGWQKSVSSNYRPYVDLLSPDGRLRPNYKLHGTKTGRMSCEKPNLQQIPRSSSKAWNGLMKQAFIPEPGFRLWEADYGQLELRLGTAYAEQESDSTTGLKRVFNEDRDVFTEMSSDLGMVRHEVKTLTYTIQYGGGVNRISTVFGISSERARALIENYYNTYPGFRVVSNLAKRRAAVAGRIQLWSGRYRHFLYPQDEARKAFNSVIQGGAADIVERSMIRLFNEVDNDDCRMLLQVHDSVVFEIREGMEDHYGPLIKNIMTDVKPDFGVKFAVDFHEWGK